MKLEGKQIGILIAMILGLVIFFLPAQDNLKYRFDPGKIAKSIETREDHIDPVTLSDWIIKGNKDYLLIDIRPAEQYEQNHIKTAENIPMPQLLEKSSLEELPQDKMIVLYSNGSSHAAQAWLVMNAAGFDAMILEGGFNYWNQAVLNPKAPETGAADDEILRYQARVAVANHFGGGSGATAGALNASQDGNTVKKAIRKPKKKKKKLGGC